MVAMESPMEIQDFPLPALPSPSPYARSPLPPGAIASANRHSALANTTYNRTGYDGGGGGGDGGHSSTSSIRSQLSGQSEEMIVPHPPPPVYRSQRSYFEITQQGVVREAEV